MSCTYQVESDACGTYDVIEDDGAGLRLRIRRLGAEMVSLARRDAAGGWAGFLYRDNQTDLPARGWTNHATVMGYFIHRLVDEQSIYRGSVIRGGNHGFLRSFEFPAPTFDPAARSLTFDVAAAAIPEGAYPLKVSLRLVYRFDGEAVRVEFHFLNEEPALTAHVSFGLHPGFAVSSVESAEILLPAGVYIRHWAPGNFLDGREEPIVFDGGPMPFDKSALPGSYILGLARVPDRTITLRDAQAGREVVLDFSEVPTMTLWSDDAAMICIEPCWGLPDSVPQKPFDQKDGIQIIQPGSSLTAGFSIRATLTGEGGAPARNDFQIDSDSTKP